VTQNIRRDFNPVHLRRIQIQFQLVDTLKGIGVTDDDLTKLASDFWLAYFFTNEYCTKDQPNPGATKYLLLLTRAGAKIVYLTGRDIPRMGPGTKENLRRNRFPMDPNDALLIMKSDPNEDDLAFKESQFASIAAKGEVLGVFENEPANINSMADAFPGADATRAEIWSNQIADDKSNKQAETESAPGSSQKAR
jgi:hypothetical protein